MRLGHDVRVFEPADAWSLNHLTAEHGSEPVNGFYQAYPHLSSTRYEDLNIDEALDGADVVLVHEWNDPALVKRIGEHRALSGDYVLLFHDTHHRSVTDPDNMAQFDLRYYDGVLAFGRSIAEVYKTKGWAQRVWVWHEAADTRVFRPIESGEERDLVWIGNWGDGERSRELNEFLIQPVRELGLSAAIYGVRYPSTALEALAVAGIHYRGWIPNFEVPRIFARHRMTVHVPRRPYATALPGIPTIRVFEALACGIPLVSAPWEDSEGLFTPGEDFLMARSGREMKQCLQALLHDQALASALVDHGLRTILDRHTCLHRANELLDICAELRPEPAMVSEEARH
jgi:spore maturation protein CgeB